MRGVSRGAEVVAVAGGDFKVTPRDEPCEDYPSVVRVRYEFKWNDTEFQFGLAWRGLIHSAPTLSFDVF